MCCFIINKILVSRESIFCDRYSKSIITIALYIENDLPVVFNLSLETNLFTSPFLLLHFIGINLLAFQKQFSFNKTTP